MKQVGKKAEEQKKEAMRRREGTVAFRMREHRIVLAGGIFTVLFAFFILVMGMEYPEMLPYLTNRRKKKGERICG